MATVGEKPPAARPRKKRRWLKWLLVSVGALVLVGGTALFSLASYYHRLIQRHTQTEPVVLEKVDISPEAQGRIKTKIGAFHNALMAGRYVEPLRLSADDLNTLVSGFGDLIKRARFQIENDQLQAVFSVPLDQGNQKKELRGRYLNGLITFDLKIEEDGFLTLHVANVTANDKPIPGWILNKAKPHDLLKFLEKNMDFQDFLMRLEAVQVADGEVVFYPEYR